jgi:polysaccharide deacetylase 2 family uncharacterized protein YibQ
MIMDKTQRASNRTSVVRKGLFIIGGVLIVGLTLLGSFHYFSPPPSPQSPPLYEEVFIKGDALQEKVRQVDRIIYQSLYLKGIAEKDIFFSEVTSRHENGHEWEFTELLVRVAEEDTAIEIQRVIHSELSVLTPSVVYDMEKVSSTELCYFIYAEGFLTHKIRLLFKKGEERPESHLPRIAMVIDDFGYDLNMALSFIHYDMPLSLSVLPIAPYTKHIVYAANREKRELMLHLPMEPNDSVRWDPGPGALLVDMNEAELQCLIREHLDRIPGLRGVNNHMGSLFSQRADHMGILFSILKEKGLFYVDSITTNRSVGYDLAKEMGLPVARRSVFLDNDLDPNAIRFQMESLMGLARYTGDALGIGHPHKETLDILTEYRYRLTTEFDVVYVSELVN